MPLRLRDHLHVAIIQQSAILLDARTERYASLAEPLNGVLCRLLAGARPQAGVDAAQPLLTAGLLVDDPSATTMLRLAPPTPPIRAFNDRRRADMLQLLRAAGAQAHAAWLVRHRSLLGLAAQIEARRPPITRSSTQDGVLLGRIADAFNRTALVFPPLDRCLPRSLAFCLLALRQGIVADLVFGVRANPFAAHCWVQRGDEVLNDSFEQVRQFTPILTL